VTVLAVWRDTRRVGVLDTAPTGDVRFTYDADVVAEARAEYAVGFKCHTMSRLLCQTVYRLLSRPRDQGARRRNIANAWGDASPEQRRN
jgi:hypothetical protein